MWLIYAHRPPIIKNEFFVSWSTLFFCSKDHHTSDDSTSICSPLLCCLQTSWLMDDMMSSVAINLNVLHQFKPGKPSEWSSKETHPKVWLYDWSCRSSCSLTFLCFLQVQWQVAVDPETGSQDELFVRGNQVVWYCGLTPELKIARVSYSVETVVLQALWCQFEESSGDGEWAGAFVKLHWWLWNGLKMSKI